MVLGERIGVISHIVSFWQYRFPTAIDLIATTEEVVDILQDFQSNLEAFNVAAMVPAPPRRRRPSPLGSQDENNPYATMGMLAQGTAEVTEP